MHYRSHLQTSTDLKRLVLDFNWNFLFKSWKDFCRILSLIFLLIIHATKINFYIQIHKFLKENQMKYFDKKKEEKTKRQRKVLMKWNTIFPYHSFPRKHLCQSKPILLKLLLKTSCGSFCYFVGLLDMVCWKYFRL